MKDNKTTIRPRLRASSTSDKPATVYFHVYHAGRSTQLNSNLRLLPSQWDNRTGQVRLPSEDTRAPEDTCRLMDVKAELARLQHHIEDIVETLRESAVPFSVSDIRRRYVSRYDATDFVSYANTLITHLQSAQRLNTARNYRTALARLTACTSTGRIPFSAITPQAMQCFERQLSLERVTPNSISCYMRSLRAIYNKAVDAGLTRQCQPFAKVYTGIARTRKRAISINVIRAIHQLQLPPHGSLALTRDLLLFSYYTRGMAFVDIAFLQKHDIIAHDTLVYHRRKTGQRIEIHLEPCMQRIIHTYLDPHSESPYVFPILSTSEARTAFVQYRRFLCRYNARLRQLASMVRYDGRLSSYSSRHTWATEARNSGIPISVISAAMGHTSERTTQIYLASMDNDIIDQANRKLCENLTATL